MFGVAFAVITNFIPTGFGIYPNVVTHSQSVIAFADHTDWNIQMLVIIVSREW